MPAGWGPAAATPTAAINWPGVCPPTSMSSMPGASVAWPLKRDRVARGAPLAQQAELGWLGLGGEVGARGERGGPERVLGLGHHQLRVRELTDVADVVPVGVGDHDGGNVPGVDTEPRQHLRRGGLARTAAAFARPRVEAGVDQVDPRRVLDHPEVVVQGQVGVGLTVAVEVEEHLRSGGDAVTVPDRQDLALAHWRSRAHSAFWFARELAHWPSNMSSGWASPNTSR